MKIKGNDGVSLATGLNHYLKYFCQVNLSQVGDQADMPENKPVVTEKVFKRRRRKSATLITTVRFLILWRSGESRNGVTS